jgi:N-formylglutamate amidohydrolase
MTTLSPPIIHQPRGDLPVLLSVPHAGREYPDWLLEDSADGIDALSTLEDPFVDRLIWRALGRGCGAVIAQTPRAAVDCNRAEDDVDPSIIDGARRTQITARARGGLGIVPSRTQQHGYLWRRPVSPTQLGSRLDQAHRPYHAAIEELLSLLLDRFGCALLIDCHSMPPPPAGIAPIIIGDCHGRSAESWISDEAMEIARGSGFEAALNVPFAGGHVVERHGDPASSVHAIQVEIDRRSYLDHPMREPGPGFDRIASLIDRLALNLGQVLLRRQFATAAE